MPSPLLTALDCEGQVHLIIGCNPLASARCAKSIEVGAKPIIVAPADAELHYVLARRVEEGQVRWVKKDYEESDLRTLGREEVDNYVDAVFVAARGKSSLGTQISLSCRRMRIPVNVVDAPNLCTFTLLSTHSDGPLHVGITTSGRGCRLASRIRREIAATLPQHLGAGLDRLGIMRRRIYEEDHRERDPDGTMTEAEDVDDDALAQRPNFNRLVSEDDVGAKKTRKMRWLAQICEYWPLKRLAAITDDDIDSVLQAYTSADDLSDPQSDLSKASSSLAAEPTIILAGSGPGSPSLLTIATYRAIQTASVILADKLVPEPVLDLIPRRTPVHIARKFPGNAEAAQVELLQLGLEALEKGLTVLRLKQGDPYVYGRGAEEYDFFREKGYVPVVLPGITSALSAPLFAAIPATHRSVADQVLICTGTGRRGAAPDAPPYIPTQTVVFLMALHRLESLISALLGLSLSTDTLAQEAKHHWPQETPCAVIERASCPDQRVVRSTLQHICAAIEEEGSRPPGLLVVGWSCEVLISLKGKGRWTTEDGFNGFGSLDADGWQWSQDSGKIALQTDSELEPRMSQVVSHES